MFSMLKNNIVRISGPKTKNPQERQRQRSLFHIFNMHAQPLPRSRIPVNSTPQNSEKEIPAQPQGNLKNRVFGLS
jgi:hypothetical protein